MGAVVAMGGLLAMPLTMQIQDAFADKPDDVDNPSNGKGGDHHDHDDKGDPCNKGSENGQGKKQKGKKCEA